LPECLCLLKALPDSGRAFLRRVLMRDGMQQGIRMSSSRSGRIAPADYRMPCCMPSLITHQPQRPSRKPEGPLTNKSRGGRPIFTKEGKVTFRDGFPLLFRSRFRLLVMSGGPWSQVDSSRVIRRSNPSGSRRGHPGYYQPVTTDRPLITEPGTTSGSIKG